MKAFIVDRYGKKDGVRVGEVADPEVRENDVLVQVHAAGVNLLDSKIRDGEFKFILPYRLPPNRARGSTREASCADLRLPSAPAPD
jgi:NADPH:quinone reductase-like Zn-dependent oxidoreductase